MVFNIHCFCQTDPVSRLDPKLVVYIIGIWIHLDSSTLALKDLMHKLLLVSHFHVILGGWNYSDVVMSSRKSYFVLDFVQDMSWEVLLCHIFFYNLYSHHQSEIRKQASHTLKYLSKRHFIYQAVFLKRLTRWWKSQ